MAGGDSLVFNKTFVNTTWLLLQVFLQGSKVSRSLFRSLQLLDQLYTKFRQIGPQSYDIIQRICLQKVCDQCSGCKIHPSEYIPYLKDAPIDPCVLVACATVEILWTHYNFFTVFAFYYVKYNFSCTHHGCYEQTTIENGIIYQQSSWMWLQCITGTQIRYGKMGPQPIVQFPSPVPIPVPSAVWTVQHNI